jgi:SPP1 gp7 family putative phage head morphogenesis protein
MQKVKGYISTKGTDLIKEFKSEVVDPLVRFPRELGVEHPFKFEDCENVYKKVGIINGAINKITDNIITDFAVKCKDKNVKALVMQFIKENNLPVVLREWVREGLIKGNGFIEISNGKLKVSNANYMFVKRNKKGDVIGYAQFIGYDYASLTKGKREPNYFLPKQIAHWKCNGIADDAYGLGLIMPNERVIENIVTNEQDRTKLISRKAGAPLHVQVGQPGESVNTADIDSFKTSLQYLTNRTEWVTDANVNMKVVDFGDLGKSLTETITSEMLSLVGGLDIPEVLLNSGQLNEGIAKVQVEGFQRKIQAYQDQIENIILNQIIYPYLEEQGKKDEVDFIWNLPSEEKINARLDKVTLLLNNPMLTENMRRMLQLEVARLLDFEEAEKFLIQPEVGLDEKKEKEKEEMRNAVINGETEPKEETNKEKEDEKDLKQPEVPGVKREEAHIHIEENFSEMSVKEFMDLKEIPGFNYSDYLIAILKRLKIDKFEDLLAKNDAELLNGLLSESDINKLKIILKDGFKKNKSMREIEQNIRDGITLRDRITSDGKTIPAGVRPEMISRTEVIRVSNSGLIDLYKQNGIQKKRWLAAMSDRTCPYCNELNGQIIGINESFNSSVGDVTQPPLHVNCRCTTIAEL